MPAPDPRRPRVLVVDDSPTLRASLTRALELEGIEVVGAAADPYHARDLILRLHPDLLTLDLQMPGMDGLSFLSRLMRHHPMPVIILSSLTSANKDLAIEAMELGAVDVFPKPLAAGANNEMKRLAGLIRGSLSARRGQPPGWKGAAALGASTGGTSAIASVIRSLPGDFPPLLIVQHMPEGFTSAFARRLDQCGALRVKEAEDMDSLEPGLALLAPGGRHMRVERGPDGRLCVRCLEGRPVNHVAPSIDVLFESMAALLGANCAAALLTGMGKDGAKGLLALRSAGARTLAQNEASSVIWGMPGEAVRLKAAESVLPLQSIPAGLLSVLQQDPQAL